MKQRMFAAFALALVLTAPGWSASAPIALEGAVQVPPGGSTPTAELRSLSDPQRTPALPFAVEAQGRTATLHGAVPEPRLGQVIVRADGAAAMALDLLPLLEESILLPLDLAPARRLAVKVTDPSGQPVAGAEVMATPGPSALPAAGGEAPGGWRPAPVSVKTGADGSALLLVAPAVPLRLTVAAPGFPRQRQEIAASAPSEIAVRLRPGVAHTIEARGGDGKPVQGAAVTSAMGEPLGVTDAAGRLTLAVAAGEPLSLRLQAADGRWARGLLKASAGDSAQPVAFDLTPAEELRGLVQDRQTHKPLAGALVWAEGFPATLATTDSTGHYALRLPSGGEVRVQAAAAGHLADRVAASLAAAKGAHPMPPLALAPAVALQGSVVDAAGKPLAGVELRAASAARRASDVEVRARTLPPGTFRLPGLSAGESYRLVASHEGFVPSRLTLAAPALGASAPPLRIVLESGRAAAGRVVDGDGKPLANAEVRLLPASSNDPRLARETTVRALTDASGAFRIERLGKGPFDLRARARGFAPTLVRRIDLPPGTAAFDLGTLVLDRGAALEGRVVDASGEPLGGATVQVTPSSGLSVWDLPLDGEPGAWEQGYQQTTASDGAFSFGGLPPSGATVTLRAERSGFAPRILPSVAIPAAEPLLVRLETVARISGTVTDESGAPVAGANILISDLTPDAGANAGKSRPRSVGAAVSDADGRFIADGLSPGRFSFLAAASGFLNTTVKGLSLPEGGELDGVEVVLRQGAIVQGTVTTPDGSPAAVAKVIAVADANPSGLSLVGRPETLSDADGHYRLSGVSEGPHTILAERSDFRPGRRFLQVQSGANALDLRLEQGAEISGLITTRSGPMAGADVRLLPNDAGAAQSPPAPQVSAPDGSFRFQQVGDGGYKLAVEKPGYAMATPNQEIRIAGAPVTGLEILLERGGAVAGRIVGLDFQDLAHVQVVATSPVLPGQAGTVGYDGTYRVEGLAAGAWTLVATLPANGRHAGGTVTLGQGQTEASLDLEFAAGFALTGRVESHGQPVPGALVLVQGADGNGGDTVTTADGRFRVEGLHPGTYALTILQTRTGLRLDQQLKLDGDRDLVLALPEAARPSQ